MFVSTTDSVQGYEIKRYFGLACGEAVVILPAGAGFSAFGKAFSGGRWPEMEQQFGTAKQAAIDSMTQQAEAWGANSVIGAKLDFESIGEKGGLILVTAAGTAVILDQDKD